MENGRVDRSTETPKSRAKWIRKKLFQKSGKQSNVHNNQVNAESRKTQIKNKRKDVWCFH